MSNLKDQIEEKIRNERDGLDKPGRTKHKEVDEARRQLDDIRPRLGELAHTTDKYSLKVGCAKGPYSAVIAVVELYAIDGTWVAAWHVGTTVGGSAHEWEVTYNPHGVETQHEWFHNSDDLFSYLTTSIADRIVELEVDEK